MSKIEKLGAAVIAAVLMFTAAHVSYTRYKAAHRVKVYEEYAVEKGDNLWRIGLKYCDANQDIRDWIAEVIEINGLSGSEIQAGSVIEVWRYDN